MSKHMAKLLVKDQFNNSKDIMDSAVGNREVEHDLKSLDKIIEQKRPFNTIPIDLRDKYNLKNGEIVRKVKQILYMLNKRRLLGVRALANSNYELVELLKKKQNNTVNNSNL